jgi:type VI secretion system secreted protein Hcp
MGRQLTRAPGSRGVDPAAKGRGDMAIYMVFKGRKQGTVAGDANAAGYEGQIVVTSVGLGMGRSVSAGSGLATGRQVVRPLVVTKRVDKSSPLLMTASVTNEVATSVLFNYVIEGEKHSKYLTVTLTNAMIQDFDDLVHDSGESVEKLVFNFQKCEYTWVDGGITAEYDMASPASS